MRAAICCGLAHCITPSREVLFPNDPGLPQYSCFLDSQISLPARLIFVTHHTDIRSIPCSTEGANRWRLLAEQGRRLRVRPRQPGLRGSRETLPGPTTWVRRETGWFGRMNAGESPRNQGRSVWPPLSAHRRRSRGLRKNAAVERREVNAHRNGRAPQGVSMLPAPFGAPLPSPLVREHSPS